MTGRPGTPPNRKVDGAMPDTPNDPQPTNSATPTAPSSEPAAVQPEPSAPANPTPAAADPMDTDAGRRALQAERQKAAEEKRRADDLAARLQEFEDKDKSELERATSRLAELEKSYAAEQQQRLRLQVATQHKIGPDDLVLLTGSTEDELNAQAARIAALNAAQAAAAATPTFAPNPAQAAGNGSPPGRKPSVATGREMFRQRHPARPTT